MKTDVTVMDVPYNREHVNVNV